MAIVETTSVTEFRAKCFEILNRITRRQTERVTITRRGNAVAMLVPPSTKPVVGRPEQLHGFLRDSVVIPAHTDLTAPVANAAFLAHSDGID